MSRFGKLQVPATAVQARSSPAAVGTGALTPLNHQQLQEEYCQQPIAKRPRYSSSLEANDFENMADAATGTTQSSKRPNFSALSCPGPNGVNNKLSSTVANAKPGTAKKLIIKNFKGKIKA